jgi:hypothetical protein
MPASTAAVAPTPPSAVAAAQVVDLSGDWTLSWTWSVTSVDFVGKVSGGPGQWAYQGTFESGGNAVWRPKKGSGTVQCSLTGQPGVLGAGRMSCSARFADGAWQGQGQGDVRSVTYGNKLKMGFRGKGTGMASDGKSATIERLELSPRN